jgi:hypothetical protein
MSSGEMRISLSIIWPTALLAALATYFGLCAGPLPEARWFFFGIAFGLFAASIRKGPRPSPKETGGG